jgi:hypothetical protein
MPPVVPVSMGIAIAQEASIPQHMICEICKDNLKANERGVKQPTKRW